MEYITGIQKLIHKKREALTAIIRLLSCSPTSTVQSAYSNRCFFIPYYFRMNLSFKEKKNATQRNYCRSGNTWKYLPWALVGVVVIYLCHDIMAYCRLFLYAFSFQARLSLVCVNSTSSSSGEVYISPCS